MREATLQQLAELVDGTVIGQADAVVSGIGTLQSATPEQITFLSNKKYARFLAGTRACAVILDAESQPQCPVNAIVCKQPYVAYAVIANFMVASGAPRGGVHPTAVIGANASIHASAWIGPYAVIEDNVTIGAEVFVGPGCVVGKGTRIDAGTRLIANVTLLHDIVVGKRVIMHPGAVIGADGFGMANDGGSWIKIPQLGTVIIGDDAEIGANTTVDRGALENTIIEEDVRLDDQVHIGHNVRVGAHTAMAAEVGIAGTTTIGKRCTIGGNSGINGHINITDDVHITGMSMVTKSISEPGVYSSGIPAESNMAWRRSVARYRRLEQMEKRMQELETKLAELTGKTDK